MKLLTQSGLLFSAVSATTATADGHYGSAPMVDWSATIAEAVQTTAIPGTLGLNPMVRSLETTYDGGKVIGGYGWFTGTATAGWLVKLFGGGCGSTAVVAVPATAYKVFTLGTATTAATCITTSYWIWSALNTAQTNAINRSNIVVSAAEEWKNGGKTATTVGGDVIYAAVGGINTNATFGLGVWSMMLWYANHAGIAMTTTLYGATSVAATATGYNGSKLWQMGMGGTDANTSTLRQDSALNISMQSACYTSVAMWAEAQKLYTGEGNIVVAGFASSANGCLDYVTDEWNVSGIYVLMAFAKDLTVNVTGGGAPGTAVTAQTPTLSIKQIKTGANQYLASAVPLDNAAGNLIYAWNFGAPSQVEPINGDNTATTVKVLTCIVLFTAPEQYGKSHMQAHYANTQLVKGADTSTFDLTQANYGMINRIWAFSMANSTETVGLWATTDTHVAFTGMRLGKGVFSMTKLSTTRTAATAADTDVYATPSPAWLNAVLSGVTQVGANAYTRQISSPAGGVAQFKGLTQATANDKYVEVNCRSIQPHFGNTAWKDINNTTTTTGTSGFLLTCMTGISQCINDHTATVGTRSATNSLLTATEHASCLNDPRYLTWRQLSIVLEWDGTVVWYRTDSYYNPASYSIGSSWGPGTVLSSHIASARDNTTITTTDQSRSYVFALADGSGIQLSHITGGSAVATAPAGNSTAGTGTDELTKAVATFSNTFPNRVEQNYCSEAKLLLAGAAASTTLATAVSAYSDGYKATVTLKLDWLLAGAQGGWRGACMVYYSTQYVSDETNGAVCVAATQTSGGLGSDLAGVKLMHVAAATWQTAMKTSSGSVTPTGAALSDAKYGIEYTPSAAAKYTFTDGYYASASWYQPKFSSLYTGIGRFGKGDFAGSYCMQGAGSTSYFSQAGSGLTLTSAVTLAAGAMSLGTALLAM